MDELKETVLKLLKEIGESDDASDALLWAQAFEATMKGAVEVTNLFSGE